jgi:hypothetical protein
MNVCILRGMSPEAVKEKLRGFSESYARDWEDWLRVAESNRVSKFALILRKWQATRPLPMRRPKAEAKHGPPHVEDLLEQARGHMGTLGDLSLADVALATPAQIAALHGLWTVFESLSEKKTASCVGITKAILLLTIGRIGPAFDSTVRKKLGLKDHLSSSEEWVRILAGIGEDILAFEKRHGAKFADVVPVRFSQYNVGRLYDMLLGPGTTPSSAATEIR